MSGSAVHRHRYYLGGTLVVEHAPVGRVAPVAVLVLPPLGYEDTSAYRPLRVLADAIAAAGHLVLRLDWPHLGDGPLGEHDDGVIPACLAAVHVAAESCRARGARRVAAVAVRGGALLALAAEGIDDRALWALPQGGKRFLREERAFHALASAAYGASPPGAVHPPSAAVEAGGFVYGAGMVEDLSALVATTLAAKPAGPGERVLLLEREGATPPDALVSALVARGADVQVTPGVGLADLLEDPYQAKLSPLVRDAVLRWLATDERVEVRPHAGTTALRGDGWRERPWVGEGGAGQLSGVVCEPSGPARAGAPWTLFFNAGGVRRSGPNRLWTRAARALAADGRCSLRLDVRDVGDSDGAVDPHKDLEAMYSQASIDDGLVAWDAVHALGAPSVDVVGLCSGAYLGVQVAARRPVRRALLFNGLAFVWNDDARASGVTAHVGRSLFDRRRWGRVLSGRIDARVVVRALLQKARLTASEKLARLRGTAPEDEVRALLRLVRAQGADIRLVASAGDPSIPYIDRHVPPGERPARVILPGVDHTIRPAWAHERVIGLIRDDAPAPG